MRIALRSNETITLTDGENNKTRYTVVNEIDRGGSSIVYRAKKHNESRFVVLKEFYPKELEFDITRDTETGALTTSALERFENLKLAFISSYNRHLQIFEEVAPNQTSYPLSQYEGCGTVFVATAPRNGDVLTATSVKKLHEAVMVIIKLTEIIKKYHDAGYLHLDIKPSNIFKDKEETNLYMFDFDSLHEKTSVAGGNVPYSYTEDWAAYELKAGLFNRIGETTDIYSIGALFYWLLFGKKKHGEDEESELLVSRLFYDKDSFKEYLLQKSPLITKCHPETPELIVEILSKTLAASSKSRYQSTDELLNDLKKLEDITHEMPAFAKSSYDIMYDDTKNRIMQGFKNPYALKDSNNTLNVWNAMLPLIHPLPLEQYPYETSLHLQIANIDKANESIRLSGEALTNILGNMGVSFEDLKSTSGEYNPEEKEQLENCETPYDLFVHYGAAGNVFEQHGDYENAIKYYKKAFDVLESIDNEQVNKDFLKAAFYYNLGFAYEQTNELDKAREYLQKSLEIYRDTLGDKHEITVSIRHMLEELGGNSI
jgi:serine/threonine protein kinase